MNGTSYPYEITLNGITYKVLGVSKYGDPILEFPDGHVRTINNAWGNDYFMQKDYSKI